jgi:hypothetical protein
MEQTVCFLSEPSLHCPEVFDSILANLSLLLGNLISYLPQKGEKEVNSFHTILLSWSSQQKIIYILEECAAMLVG